MSLTSADTVAKHFRVSEEKKPVWVLMIKMELRARPFDLIGMIDSLQNRSDDFQLNKEAIGINLIYK